MKHDIIILGGGIVGLSLAGLCAKQGLSVTVLEKTPYNPSVDNRYSAISKGSKSLFEKLNVWQAMIDKASAYEMMKVWDGAGFGEIEFSASDMGEENLGHIIQNRCIMEALLNGIKTSPVQYIDSAIPSSIEILSDKASVFLTDGTLHTGSLVVGADGQRSWCREQLKMDCFTMDYHQKAIVCTVKTELPHEQTAWQRFCPTGPLAFLPLSDPFTCSIVWSIEETQAPSLLELDETSFKDALGSAFDFRLGRVMECSERKAFPLHMQVAKAFTQERVALVGDSAHVIHPLAGQGVNLGLSDVAALVRVVKEAHEKDFDMGDGLILRKYERSRKSGVWGTALSMSFLNSLFKPEMLCDVRGLGFNWVDKQSWMKQWFFNRAVDL